MNFKLQNYKKSFNIELEILKNMFINLLPPLNVYFCGGN